MSSIYNGDSQPASLPTDIQIRKVFKETYSWFDQEVYFVPDEHLDLVQKSFLAGYPLLSVGLHGLLTVRSEQNDPRISGTRVGREAGPSSPLLSVHGLNRTLDVEQVILPHMQRLFQKINHSSVETGEKLARMANVAAIVTAESQSFSDGNTRIARTTRSFIRGRLSGVSTRKTFDSKINFIPPSAVESLVLRQNTTRLLKGVDSRWPQAGVAVSEDAVSAIAEATDYLNRILYQPKSSTGVIPFETREASALRRYGENVAFRERMQEIVGPETGAFRSPAFALLQKHYGPAAWAVAFHDGTPSIPLSEDDIKKLVDADAELLRMRVISLAAGAAIGGHFNTFRADDSGELAPGGTIGWEPEWP